MRKLNVLIAVGLFGVFSNVGEIYAKNPRLNNAENRAEEGPISRAERYGIPPDEYIDSLGIPPKKLPKKGMLDWFRDRLTDDGEILSERDQNFGSGLISTTVGTSDDAIRAIIIQTDGKILSAGRKNISGTNDDFLVTRYHADGELDTSFNTTGNTVASFGGGNEYAHAVTYDALGRAVAAGRTDSGVANAFDFAIVRFAVEGALDTTFNTTGRVSTPIATGAEFVRGVSVQSVDGRIVAAGYYRAATYYNFAVARYMTDGSIDTSFNTTGLLTIANGSNDNGANTVDIDTTGRIVLGGASYNGTDWDFAVVRVNTNGTIDTSFRTTGSLTTAVLASDDIGYSSRVDPVTGNIVMSGTAYNGTKYKWAAVRWLSNGVLDTTFNTTGKLNSALSANDERIFGISLETNGAVVAAGFSYNGTDNDFAVGRYSSNGALDTSFNTFGYLTQAIGAAEDTAQAVHLLLDGIILVGGRSHNATNLDFAVARYNSDGTRAFSGYLDQSMGTKGQVNGSNGAVDDVFFGAGQQTDGKILAAGRMGHPGGGVGFAVARFTISGALDTTFNSVGYLTRTYNAQSTAHAAYGVSVQTDGKVVVAGNIYTTATKDSLGVQRHNTDGSMDTTFNTTGTYSLTVTANQNTRAYALALQSDGLIVVGGSDWNTSDSTQDFFVVRLTSAGILDTAFNLTGKARRTISSTADEIFGLALQTDGSIGVAGYYVNSVNHAVVGRFRSNGSVDTSFNSVGWINPIGPSAGQQGFYGVAVSENNTLVAVGYQSSNNSILLSRTKSDGSMDTSFAADGVAFGTDANMNSTAILRSVAVTPNSKIVGSGYNHSTQNFLVVRYTTGGVLDTTFTTQGVSVSSFGADATRSYGVLIQKDGRITAVGANATNSGDWAIMRFWP